QAGSQQPGQEYDRLPDPARKARGHGRRLGCLHGFRRPASGPSEAMTSPDAIPSSDLPRRLGVLTLGACAAFVIALAGHPMADEAQPAGAALRIAVVAYQDAARRLGGVEPALFALRTAAGLKEPLAVARGTYADLLHWLETGAVDLAVVSPALLGKALEVGGSIRWEYLASVRTPPDPSPSLSVAVVREPSPIRTTDDLQNRLTRGQGRLLLLDPLSVAGALAPRVALAAAGIPVSESRIRYTHSHTNSLRALRPDDANDAVAFVWNGMLNERAMAGLRKVELPTLAGLRI